MTFRKCECGCGREFPVTAHNRKYYSESCRVMVCAGKRQIVEEKSVKWNELSPGERWELMSLAQVDAECKEMHMSYGTLQGMYYNGCLPEGFGLKKKG